MPTGWHRERARRLARPAHYPEKRLGGRGSNSNLVGAGPLKQPQHSVDNCGIPLRSAAGFQNFQSLAGRNRFAVRAFANHRMERVGDGDDTCLERDIFTGQTIGVTGAVPTFVVRSHDQRAPGQRRNLIENPLARGRVVAHYYPLFFGQGSALKKDRFGCRDLPYVMQNRAELYQCAGFGRYGHRRTKAARPFAGGARVTARGGVSFAKQRQKGTRALRVFKALLGDGALARSQSRCDFGAQGFERCQQAAVIEFELGGFTCHSVNCRRDEFACAGGPQTSSLASGPVSQADRLREIHRHAKTIEQNLYRPFQSGVAD